MHDWRYTWAVTDGSALAASSSVSITARSKHELCHTPLNGLKVRGGGSSAVSITHYTTVRKLLTPKQKLQPKHTEHWPTIPLATSASLGWCLLCSRDDYGRF
jgi:hypothetical protein